MTKKVFYRLVKAPNGHKFAGLYGVEKLVAEKDRIVESKLVHEWDSRIISEAILAKMGGSEAYDEFEANHPEVKHNPGLDVEPVKARTADQLKEMSGAEMTKALKGQE